MNRIAQAVGVWLGFSMSLFAADFSFVTIDFPNASETIASGINARGDIVGRYSDKAGVAHGFRLSGGVFTSIDFPNSSFTSARGINARGDIAGRTKDQAGVDHAYLLRDGHFTRIDFPGAVATVGRGINNAGDITGNYTDTANNEIGFLLQKGKYYSLRANPCSTDLWSIMDNGVVGTGDACINPDSQLFGYIRKRPGDYSFFQFPIHGSFACTAPRWINERSEIVGIYLVANSSQDCYDGLVPSHGFLLRAGKYTEIKVPGSLATDAFAINDDGQIVGDYTDASGKVHGYRAVPQ